MSTREPQGIIRKPKIARWQQRAVVAMAATLLVGLSFHLSSRTSAGQPGPDKSEKQKIHLQWKASLVDDVLAELAAAGKGNANFLCDTYDSDVLETDEAGMDGTIQQAVYSVAHAFRRTPLVMGRTFALRYDRWFDLREANLHTRTAENRRREATVSVCTHPAHLGNLPATGRSPGHGAENTVTKRVETTSGQRIDISATRYGVERLLEKVGRLTGERYGVVDTLRHRRISCSFTAATSSELRTAIVFLFPDSEWVGQRGAWTLRERKQAALVRAVAENPGWRNPHNGFEDLTALKVQVAADLTPEQYEMLKQPGVQVRIPWQQLSAAARDLLLQNADRFRDVVIQNGGSAYEFLDPSRMTEWEIRLGLRKDGTLQMERVGWGLDGTLVHF